MDRLGKSFFGTADKADSAAAALAVATSPSFTRRVHDSGDLRKVFDRFDANRDGYISLTELQSVLRSLGCPTDEAAAMMAAADGDGDGFISFEEFLSANTAGASSARCLEDLREAFSVYDHDRNGLISAEELHRVLCSMGENVSVAACKSMIRSVDKNGDGAVNFEEFVQMMTKSTRPGNLA